jgi:LPXTG-motif cell wall-anchored protein
MSNGVLIGVSSHPVVIKVSDSSAGGLPATGDNFTPVFIAAAILIVGLAFIGFSLRAGARQRKKTHQLMVVPLLVVSLIFGLSFNASPLTAQAVPAPHVNYGSTINITIDKSSTNVASVGVTVDGFYKTDLLYLDIVAALQDELPGVTFSIEGDTFDTEGDTATKHVSDPLNQDGGLHTLPLTVEISDDLAVGTYTDTVELSVIDTRTLLAVGGITLQDRDYDGTVDVTAVGTPTLLNVAMGDQVFLSNPSYVVESTQAGISMPVRLQGTLTGDDAFKYALFIWSGSGGVIPFGPIIGVVDITPKPLTFTGSISYAKPYDGTDTVDLADIQIASPSFFSGLVGTEGFTLSASGITFASFADDVVGTNKPITYVGSFSLVGSQNGANASNYVLTPPTIVGTIS